MARKRKKRGKSTGGRRRRVSGVHPVIMQTATMVAGAAVGAIAGVFVNQAIKSSFTTMPTWIGGGVAIVIGGALPLFVKNSPFIQGAAGGLVGAGTIFATNETVLSLPGVSGVPLSMKSPSTSMGNGFLNRTVGAYRGIPANRIGAKNRMGNLSGEGSSIVAGILSN